LILNLSINRLIVKLKYDAYLELECRAILFGFTGQDFGNGLTEALAANLKAEELTDAQDEYLITER